MRHLYNDECGNLLVERIEIQQMSKDCCDTELNVGSWGLVV